MPVPIDEYTVTLSEAAAILGGSEKAIQRLIFTAKLDAIRVKVGESHEFRVRPDELRDHHDALRRHVEEIDSDAKPQRRTETGALSGPTHELGVAAGTVTPSRSMHGDQASNNGRRQASKGNAVLPLGFGLPDEPAVYPLDEEEEIVTPPTESAVCESATAVVSAAAAEEESIESLVGAISAMVDGSGKETTAWKEPGDVDEPFVAITVAPPAALDTLPLELPEDEEWDEAGSTAVAIGVAPSRTNAEGEWTSNVGVDTAPIPMHRIVAHGWDDDPTPTIGPSTQKAGLLDRVRRFFRR